MAKEPNTPSGSNQPPDPEDARAEFWEATFFSPDGAELSEKHSIAEEPAPAEPRVAGQAEPAIKQTERETPARQDSISREAHISADQHAEDLGEAMHAKFMHLLNAKMEETGGHLTPEDVEEMGEEFRDNLDDIKTAFVKAVESYTLARERGRIDSARTHLFTRLMVRKFEHRLRDERTLREKPDYLSRRMLPGFANMLSMMFGKPKLADYENRIKIVTDKMRNANGGHIDWEEFYRTPEIKKLALRAEIEIAQNFRNIDKRFQWMVAMINSNLIPADDIRTGAEWTFNDAAATKLLTSLFADVRAALKNPNARERFTATLGEEAVGMLDNVALRFR